MERIIGELGGDTFGPLIILVGGLHGNEHQGVIALENIIKDFEDKDITGKVLAIRGNLEALKAKKRFIHKDLNRAWDTKLTDQELGEEKNEVYAIKSLINNELNREYSACYLIDLHTTSAPTVPFIVADKNEETMALVSKLNIPFITGVQGFLDGTLLQWFSAKGHCGFAFEAGQHHSKKSMIKHEAFVKLCLQIIGSYKDFTPLEVEEISNLLDDELRPRHNHFKLVERYKIDEGEEFTMEPGFTNFQKIYKSEVLAKNQHGDILSQVNANIFMPLYQKQGNDGFFIIEPVL